MFQTTWKFAPSGSTCPPDVQNRVFTSKGARYAARTSRANPKLGRSRSPTMFNISTSFTLYCSSCLVLCRLLVLPIRPSVHHSHNIILYHHAHWLTSLWCTVAKAQIIGERERANLVIRSSVIFYITSRRMHGIFGERERAHIHTSQPRQLTTCSLEPRRLQASVRHQRVQRMPPNGRRFSPWLGIELAARASKKFIIISKRVILTHAQ